MKSSTSKMATTGTVDSYIKAQPKEVQPILKKIREIIKATAPKADEAMNYGMPGYKMNGKPLVYFGGFKKHIGFYATPAGNAAFPKEIAGYKGAKGSIQFQLDEPIPYPLIKKMVAFRVKENKAKAKK